MSDLLHVISYVANDEMVSPARFLWLIIWTVLYCIICVVSLAFVYLAIFVYILIYTNKKASVEAQGCHAQREWSGVGENVARVDG